MCSNYWSGNLLATSTAIDEKAQFQQTVFVAAVGLPYSGVVREAHRIYCANDKLIN